MIKNIIFDFGNVLAEWNVNNLITNFTKQKEEQEILINSIFKTKEWIKIDEGKIDYQTATNIFKQRVPENLKGKAEEIMNKWFEYVPIDENVLDLIKILKQKGYKVYLLSNTSVPVYGFITSSKIGKDFDGFLISAIEKMIKPNKEIYLRLFEKFSIKPEESFFIDDNEENIKASIECGMNGYIHKFGDITGLENKLKENNIL